MESQRCPSCGKPTVILGLAIAGRENVHGASFLPRNCRPSHAGNGIPLQGGALFACVSCGHAWTNLNPCRLRDHIETHGQEIAKQELDEIDRGPYRDLPATSLGREIGDKIREIDRLVRDGRIGHIGRYRELRGVIWDQAIKETRNWADLTREEKLELFGWISKKKPPVDGLD
jgi:hypothetical protein